MPKAVTGQGMAGYQNDLIGDHPSIIALRELIERVARSPAQTVLVYGPTGTGKGMVARMLHKLSQRASKQFVDINCAAIPSSLLESELFGHEKGAFTGATDRKTGLVEAANHGTIFLDEIREMEPMLQAKLLSLLDTHEFRRVGAVKTTSVDVRVSRRPTRCCCRRCWPDNFREDLYYRLQVVAINIPALKDRGRDVLTLSDYFIAKYNERYNRKIAGLSDETAEIFLKYPVAWQRARTGEPAGADLHPRG
jgi:two-component system response regulator AtoC